jgi:predicted amidohydrolase YtcJ
MGIVTSVQPAFLGSEVDWLEDRVGPDRLPFTYPLRSLQRAGATLAGGSDCPVESPNPFAGMALAIDRAGIVVEEGLEPAAALGLFTQATALQEPAPLATGSPADLIVVDRNPVEVTPDELRETRVLGTFVDGAEVEVERTRPYWVD